MPSIASVSRLNLTTRRAEAAHAWAVIVRDGTVQAAAPAAHLRGTSVEVRDLFFNVPARRKFLRSEQTEFQHAARMLERLALSRFDVAFSLMHNGKAVFSLPVALTEADQLQRVAAICGEEFAGHVLAVQHQTESWRLSGWLALPTFSRGQADLQYAYVNGRYIRDKLLGNAVRLGYQDVLFGGPFSAYCLYLELDPVQVDVNAHPQKLEVRFRDSRQIHDFVFRTVDRALATTRPTHESSGSALTDWLHRPNQAHLHLPYAKPAALGADIYRSFVTAAAQTEADAAHLNGTPPLGIAIAQLHGIYILSATADGLGGNLTTCMRAR